MNFKKEKEKQKLDALISNYMNISGEIKFRGSLRIEGTVIGNVIAENDNDSILIIAEGAIIEGEIKAGHIVINGKVGGQVTSTKLLELESKANVAGDINYFMIQMHSGAIISGKLNHIGPKEELQ